jgi:hypothetical protein
MMLFVSWRLDPETKEAAMRRMIALTALIAVASGAAAQGPPDPRPLIDAQKAAMAKLSRLDGVWRGPAWTILPGGQRQDAIQTERIGPFLDGAVKVVEGRGYDPNTGAAMFNALGVISFDPATQSYNLRTYAQGRMGDFKLTPTADGYVWEIAAGPMTLRYTVVITDTTWHEVGDRIMPNAAPVRFMEMTLNKVGASDWPAGGAIPMK